MDERARRSAKASQLRARLSRGKPISRDEQAWLDEYSRRVKRGRPVNTDLPPLPPKPAMDDSPLPPLEVQPPADDNPVNSANDGSPAGAVAPSTEPAGEPSHSVESEDAAALRGTAFATTYCDWLKKVNRDTMQLAAELKSSAIVLPDELIDSFIHPIARNAFTRLARKYGEDLSERAENWTIIGATAGCYAQRRLLQDRKSKAQSAAQPRAVPAQPGQRPSQPSQSNVVDMFGTREQWDA